MMKLSKLLFFIFIIISGLLYNISMADFATEWVIQTHNSFKEGTVYSTIYPDGNSIAVDNNGDIYTVGSFQNGTGGQGILIGGNTLVSSGSFDGFISKFDDDGNSLWVKKIGGTSYDKLQSVVVDSSDNVYVMGYFASSANIFGTTLTSGGGYDIFVAKLNSNGDLQWLKQSSGSSSEYSHKLSVDDNGNIYLVGFTYSCSALFGESITTSGGEDIFVAKLDTSGNILWVKVAGGTGYDRGKGVVVDSLGNVYVTGYFDDIANIFGTSLTSDTEYYDIFLAKLDSSGDAVWVKQAGGPTLYDKGYDLGIDFYNNVYIAGTYGNNANIFGITKNPRNYDDTFVAKLDTSGNTLWVKDAGGISSSSINSLFIDNRNNVYITGRVYGNTLFYGIPIINSGSSDIYIAKLKGSTGNTIFVKSTGGSSAELGNTIIGNNKGLLYLIGKFKSTSVNIFGTMLGTAGTVQQNEDYFIAKFQDEEEIEKEQQNNTKIDGGFFHSCKVETDSTVKCWGYNHYGQLGIGSRVDNKTMVEVPGLTNVDSISLGKYHTCALIKDGTIQCWGRNNRGQIGDGTGTRRTTPVTVSGIDNAISIAAGDTHTCAVLSDNTVKCWGRNSYGQLGNGTDISSNIPVTVTGITTATDVSVWGYHSCALLENNTMKCWGRNNKGQLGDGTRMKRETPVSVFELTNVSTMTLGRFHTCAVLNSGKIKCWGRNQRGQLGDGTGSRRIKPVEVTGISNAIDVVLGEAHTCGLLDDDSIKCWGYNYYGQLGNGTTTSSNVPVTVSNISDIDSMGLGGNHSCALLDDDSVKCWGRNNKGQLGDGTTHKKTTATTVIGDPAEGTSITRNDGYSNGEVFLAGEQGAKLMQFVINAGPNSVIDVRKLNFDFDMTDADYTDFTNLKLVIAGSQEGSTEDLSATIAPDGTVTIDDINYDIARNNQATFELYANIDTSTVADNLDITLDVSDSLFYDDNDDEMVPNDGNDVNSATLAIKENAELWAAVDGDTPEEDIIVADIDDVEVARFEFTAIDGDVSIKDLYFRNVATNADDARISALKLVVNGSVVDSRVPSNDQVHFSLGSSNRIDIAKNDDIVIVIKADLNDITGAEQTNKGIKLELTDLEAEAKATSKDLTQVENNGGTDIDDGDHYTTSALAGEDLQSDDMYIRKTQPTLAAQDLGTSKLLAGEQTIYKFTVSADSKGDIEVAQIKFDVSSSLREGTTLDDFKLYEGYTEIEGFDTLVGDTVAEFRFTDGQELVIPAGNLRTFELKGTITGGLDNGDNVTTKISEDELDTDANGDAKATAVVAVESNFIWSDNSGAPHSELTEDWFNGYLVNGLDTTSTTLED